MAARLRWIATQGDASLAAVVSKMGEGAVGALAEGRAFVNGVRAPADRALAPGDVVEIWDARDAVTAPLTILYDEGDILAVDKPAGLPTMPDHRGLRSLSEAVAEHLRASRRRGHGEAHPVSRLDAPVSGVVVFALSRAARKRLEDASAAGRFEKHYVAITRGALDGAGLVEAPVDGKPAKSRYAVRARAAGASLVDLSPVTGRTHQLRIHMASLGHPIFGDRARGGPTRITDAKGSVHAVDRILLHAHTVRVTLGPRMVSIESPVAAELALAWGWLGGEPSAWSAPRALP